MKSEKKSVIKKSTSRKAVSVAIAKQDKENEIASAKNSQDLYEAIAFKAYELFLGRGGSHGNDMEDWLEAERIIVQG